MIVVAVLSSIAAVAIPLFQGYLRFDITKSPFSTQIAAVNPERIGHLSVTLGGNAHPNFTNAVVRFERTGKGVWPCVINISNAASWSPVYETSNCTM
jgi:hypothetical protein